MTFLDCIYVEVESTYYILDFMIWNNYQYYDCDTECRRFLLQSRLDENPQVKEKSNVNPYMFKMLPSYSCDPEVIKTTLMTKLTFDPLPLDGLLFYCKGAHYLPGQTPLVGWLKGFMVPEMLGIGVSKELMAQRPNAYATMNSHIKEYEEERKNRGCSTQKQPMQE